MLTSAERRLILAEIQIVRTMVAIIPTVDAPQQARETLIAVLNRHLQDLNRRLIQAPIPPPGMNFSYR